MRTLSRWIAALLICATAGCSASGATAPASPAPGPTTPAAAAPATGAAVPAPPANRSVPPTPTLPDLVRRVNAGIESEFVLGEPIPLTGEIMVELAMEQGRSKFARYLDVFVYRGNPSDPIDDASVKVLGAMREMEHGSFRLGASPEGGGHYTLSMPTIMPGQWFLDITVTSGGKETTLHLMLELFD